MINLLGNILIGIIKIPFALAWSVLCLIAIVAVDAVAEHDTKMSGYRTIHYVNPDASEKLLSAPWEWVFKRTFK